MPSSPPPAFPVKGKRPSSECPRPKLREELLDFVDHIERQGLDFPNPQHFICTASELDEILRVSSVFYRKAKYVYDQRAQLLTVYMPDLFHDHVVGATFEEWKRQAYAVIDKHNISHLPDLTIGTPLLKHKATDICGQALNRRIPDMSFWPMERSAPSWTGEVSHTQSKRDLPGVAEDVIGGTRGATKAVFTLNCDKMETPTVQVYRPKKVRGTWIVQPTIPSADEAVRQTTGVPYAGKRVTLHLSDFFPENIPSNSTYNHEVHITYHTLSQIVYKARHLQLKYEATCSSEDQYPEATMLPTEPFFKRPRTPEPMATREERARQRQRERSIQLRQAVEDPDWTPRRR